MQRHLVTVLFLPLFIAHALAVASNLCSIRDHRSAIVGNKLYFSSGNYTFDNGSEWVSSPELYVIDLSKSIDVSGLLPLDEVDQITLPSAELAGGYSPISGGASGTFLYDHTTLYAYGALEGESANGTINGLWTFNTTNSTWGITTVGGGQLEFSDVTDGVFANDPAHGLSWYTGGYGLAYNNTNNGIVRLDTSDPSSPQWDFLTAVTSMQGPDILKGAMVYVRKGKAGILVAFGGYNTTSEGTEFAVGGGWPWDQRPLSDIFVYDIYSNQWYLIEAGGDIPVPRAEFCAGVSSAPDDSSFQIIMHGGWDQFNDVTYDETYVLTIPAFQWIQIDTVDDPDDGVGRNRLTCDMYSDRVMVVTGGSAGAGDFNAACNSSYPPLKVLDTSTFIWQTEFQPGLENYTVPDVISNVVGGNALGSATVHSPIGGWNSSDIQDIFSQTVARDTYNASATTASSATPSPSGTAVPTKSPEPSPGNHHVGAIAGGVVGGVAALAIIAFLVWWLWSRRTRQQRRDVDGRESKIAPSEHDNWTKAELGGADIQEMGNDGSKMPAELGGTKTTAELENSATRWELSAAEVPVAELGAGNHALGR